MPRVRIEPALRKKIITNRYAHLIREHGEDEQMDLDIRKTTYAMRTVLNSALIHLSVHNDATALDMIDGCIEMLDAVVRQEKEKS